MAESPREKALSLLEEQGLVRSMDFERAGIHRQVLARMVEEGLIERVSRGVFATPEFAAQSYVSWAALTRRIPDVVFVLDSAAVFHELTVRNPAYVTVSVVPGQKKPTDDMLSIRATHWGTLDDDRDDIQMAEVCGTRIRVTTPQRTVIDLFRYRHKIGEDFAVECLASLRSKGFRMDPLIRRARDFGVASFITQTLSALDAARMDVTDEIASGDLRL
jgi:hypothetical protein